MGIKLCVSVSCAAEDMATEEAAEEGAEAGDGAATQTGAPVMYIGNVPADVTRADLRKV